MGKKYPLEPLRSVRASKVLDETRRLAETDMLTGALSRHAFHTQGARVSEGAALVGEAAGAHVHGRAGLHGNDGPGVGKVLSQDQGGRGQSASQLIQSTADLPAAADIAGFLAMRPPVAEASGIAMAVAAAAATQARVHIRQISSALGVETFRRMKGMADVSIETTPQCLLFTQADYRRLGAVLKASPPLREAEDVAALRQAFLTGGPDAVSGARRVLPELLRARGDT